MLICMLYYRNYKLEKVLVMKDKYLFGPVPSRRLGMSLGIDLVPYKTCTLDCVYCECGATTKLTLERGEYVPTAKVIEQLDEYLSTNPELDYITFSGAGEPTLHIGMAEIVSFVKGKYPEYKMCLLTNATLLGNPEVVDAIKCIDLIIPSLDAVTCEDFVKVNRPSDNLDIDKFIQDLISFCNLRTSVIWLEIFIVPGCNDSKESLREFKNVVEQIKPDKIQLNTLDRPGAVDWIKTPTQDIIDLFVEALEDIAPLEVVGKFTYSNNSAHENISQDDLVCKVKDMISRRPCTVKDIVFSLSLSYDRVTEVLCKLEASGEVVCDELKRGRFYRLKSI